MNIFQERTFQVEYIVRAGKERKRKQQLEGTEGFWGLLTHFEDEVTMVMRGLQGIYIGPLSTFKNSDLFSE